MSYIRVYPSRGTTIFKRSSGGAQEILGTVNTGKNTIHELMDGNSQSAILMNFDISSIKTKLQNYSYTCSLKMWDAGVIFEPTINLKTIDLLYFTEEFTEGDGFSFLGASALPQAANWLERVDGTAWSPVQPGTFTQGLFPAYQLNEANEDITINGLTTFVDNAITASANPSFGIRISNNTVDGDTFTKFLHSRHTRTIYKPFLEFTIDDNIVDGRYNAMATQLTRLYLLTDSGVNFVGTSVIAQILDNTGAVLATPTIVNPTPGVYYIEYTPLITEADSILFDTWSVDGIDVASNVFKVNSPNTVSGKNNTKNLYFFPTTSYLHPIVKKNDVVLFNLISEIRGLGSIMLPGYEYKVVTTSNFEMQGWTPVNIYDNKLFFTIDTKYYFTELEYEVLVRLKEGASIKTSAMTYRFRVVADGATHLDDVSASPYNSRDKNFYK